MSNICVKPWRGYHFFLSKPVILLTKYERWRKVADTLGLSKSAKQRLEWTIFYETKAQDNVRVTCRHFYISPKTFYKWYNRFDEQDLKSLEDQDKAPKNRRQKEITPLEESRIVSLRKRYIRYGSRKIAVIYQRTHKEKISSWKVQYTIQKYKLYYNPKKVAKLRLKRQRAQKKKRITELRIKKKAFYLIQLDSIVIHWNGLKRYILTSIDVFTKIAFARMYTSHSSKTAADFLKRLYFLLDEKIINTQTDNGSEFAKYYEKACQELKVEHYYSRLRTPQDNCYDESFNRTLRQEFIQLGNFSPNCQIFNPNLTEWLIEYNFIRPHESLGYRTPMENYAKINKVLPMYPSCARG